MLPISSSTSPLLQMQYRMQHAELGIDLERGQVAIQQPAADLWISQPQGDLTIDQSRAWDALGKAKLDVLMRRITDHSWGMAAEGVRNIVQKGNMMAAIHENRNVFAEIGKMAFPLRGNRGIQYHGRASMLNVDISYTANPPIIEAKANEPYINIEPNRVHIYLKQKPEFEIIPPRLDIFV